MNTTHDWARQTDRGACRGKTTSSRDLARRIRLHALRMTNRSGGAHIGAIFSCADILAVLYDGVLNVDSADPGRPTRDRFIVSKGHVAAGLYAVLAERGFFPVEKLVTHYQNGSDLCGHVSHRVAGIEVSTGALGHGLSIACGMAYAGMLRSASHRVVCLLSDGECDEGSTWEAALFAAHHGLSNLVVIVDYNRIQGIAPVAEVIELEPFSDKWKAFGWAVREVDGHDHDVLRATLNVLPFAQGKPSCLIAHTIKGKGVSFMENTVLWHYRIARGAEFEAAVVELEAEA
ncbi:MAG: transketolase [Acidobacteriales bacterium]|nr:transketolase [Terriglobales bacterium]